MDSKMRTGNLWWALGIGGLVCLIVVLVLLPGRGPTTPAGPEPMSFGIADQVAAVRSAVVHVDRLGLWQGSGCLLTPDGILFTAKHVSETTPGNYQVTLDDGRQFAVKYVIEDRENDVTFMQLDLAGAEPNLPTAALAREDTLRVGDGVFIMGSPLGYDNFNSVSLGILAAKGRELYERQGWESYRRYTWHVMLQTTSPAFPGNSGGPIFNMRGDVVGVLVAGQAATLNFGVPVARFAGTIETVRKWFALCRFQVVSPSSQMDVTPVEGMSGGYHSWEGR